MKTALQVQKTAQKLEIGAETLSGLQLRYAGDWVWRTVFSMAQSGISLSSFRQMAERLNVSTEDVLEAIEGLEKMGAIQISSDGTYRSKGNIQISDRDVNSQQLMSEHVLISTQILNRLNPFTTASKNFYRTGFLSTNRELMREFCLKVEDLMKEFLEKSETAESVKNGDAKADDVYAFTFSALNVTEGGIQ